MDENIRFTPKQGLGICEIAQWLLDCFPKGIHSVIIWISNLIDSENCQVPDDMFGIGNAHWVLITDDYVFIGNEYFKEKQVIMTREQLLYVLEQYKAFLEGSYKDPNNPSDPIDVEFIAEGQDAINRYHRLEGSHLVPYAG